MYLGIMKELDKPNIPRFLELVVQIVRKYGHIGIILVEISENFADF